MLHDTIKKKEWFNMSLREDLKSVIIKSGWTMGSVVDEINKQNGTNYSLQNFSAKLSRNSLKYVEVVQILKIIGYEIKWEQINC